MKFIFGNWKMHGSLIANEDYLETLFLKLENLDKNVICGVAVPYPFLFQFSSRLLFPNFWLGCQNVSAQSMFGAFTGEVHASMLKELDCSFGIVGHSERRESFVESDELIAQKASRLLENGIQPVICVGESEADRNSGKAKSVIENQVDSLVREIGSEHIRRCIVAYEPIWAIGGGKIVKISDIQDVISFIRQKILGFTGDMLANSTKIIYGGSVSKENISELLDGTEIDGVLVGSASLDAKGFVEILSAAEISLEK
tara:strand:+ start:5869 stop:6639 length:771 start_codon:yes stop_codon:yes gene_type:complete